MQTPSGEIGSRPPGQGAAALGSATIELGAAAVATLLFLVLNKQSSPPSPTRERRRRDPVPVRYKRRLSWMTRAPCNASRHETWQKVPSVLYSTSRRFTPRRGAEK